MPPDGPLYLVAELQVHDRELLLTYAEQVQPVMARYGGRIVAANPAPTVLEGDWHPDLLVVHRWESEARFRDFWESHDYQPIKHVRHRACDSRIVVTPGLPEETVAVEDVRRPAGKAAPTG